jgi:hypothetical protein
MQDAWARRTRFRALHLCPPYESAASRNSQIKQHAVERQELIEKIEFADVRRLTVSSTGARREVTIGRVGRRTALFFVVAIFFAVTIRRSLRRTK